MTIFLYDRVENIVGKGENAGFSPFPSVFQSLLPSGRKKLELCGKELNCEHHQPLIRIF